MCLRDGGDGGREDTESMEIGAKGNGDNSGILLEEDAHRPSEEEGHSVFAFHGVCAHAVQRKGEKSQILSDIHGALVVTVVVGWVRPGNVLALLGPSGSGKTTLLSVLAGREQGLRVEGSVTLGNKPMTKNAVRRIGLVPQDSVLFGALTVWESVLYAAELRLPGEMPRERKRQLTQETIDKLGLRRCQNIPVEGMRGRKGISGGEKKRTSIAVELISQPSVLICDEPTSGLDANIALRCVQALARRARDDDLPVIVSVHQPASRIFKAFSDTLILSEGETILRGPPDQLSHKLAERGHALPAETNISDFALDIAAKDFASQPQRGVDEERSHLLHLNAKEERLSVLPHVSGRKPEGRVGWRWPTSRWNEFVVLTKRGIKARSERFFDTAFLVQVSVVAIIASVLWWQKGASNTESNVQDMIGFAFFETIFQAFIALFTATNTFPSERAIVAFERKGGWYRLSPYYFSRTLTDMVLNLIAPTIFVLITYFSVGVGASASTFFAHYGILVVNVFAAASLGLMAAAIMQDQGRALVLATVTVLASLLAGGFYVRDPPNWSRDILWLSFIGYSYAALLKTIYPEGSTYVSEEGEDGLPLREDLLPDPTTATSRGVQIAALFAFVIAFRLVAFLALTRTLRL